MLRINLGSFAGRNFEDSAELKYGLLDFVVIVLAKTQQQRASEQRRLPASHGSLIDRGL